MFVKKKIRPVRTQNKISAPLIGNKYKIDITQKCNSLHQKYVNIRNMQTSTCNTDLIVNINTTIITLLTWFHYQWLILNTPSVVPISIHISGFNFLTQSPQFQHIIIRNFKLHSQPSLPSFTYKKCLRPICFLRFRTVSSVLPESTTRKFSSTM